MLVTVMFLFFSLASVFLIKLTLRRTLHLQQFYSTIPVQSHCCFCDAELYHFIQLNLKILL